MVTYRPAFMYIEIEIYLVKSSDKGTRNSIKTKKICITVRILLGFLLYIFQGIIKDA